MVVHIKSQFALKSFDCYSEYIGIDFVFPANQIKSQQMLKHFINCQHINRTHIFANWIPNDLSTRSHPSMELHDLNDLHAHKPSSNFANSIRHQSKHQLKVQCEERNRKKVYLNSKVHWRKKWFRNEREIGLHSGIAHGVCVCAVSISFSSRCFFFLLLFTNHLFSKLIELINTENFTFGWLFKFLKPLLFHSLSLSLPLSRSRSLCLASCTLFRFYCFRFFFSALLFRWQRLLRSVP